MATLADNIDLGDFNARIGQLFDGFFRLVMVVENGDDGAVYGHVQFLSLQIQFLRSLANGK
jgi:hypothetical protein